MGEPFARNQLGTHFIDRKTEREYLAYVERGYMRFEVPVQLSIFLIFSIVTLIRLVKVPELVSPGWITGVLVLNLSVAYGCFAGRKLPGAAAHSLIPALGLMVAYAGAGLMILGSVEAHKLPTVAIFYVIAALGAFFPQTFIQRIVVGVFGLGAVTASLMSYNWQSMPYPALVWLQLAAAFLILVIFGVKHEIASRDSWIKDQNLVQAREQTRNVLMNVLPEYVVTQFETLGEQAVTVKRYQLVSVLFADIVGFSRLTQTLPTEQIARILDDLFSRFDLLCQNGGVEKIKTIGDAYLCIAGAPRPCADHAARIADMALEFREAMARYRDMTGIDLHIRIGIHTGPVVAGLLGRSRYSYDLWGDTVNVASRLESHGVVDQIQASREMVEAAGDRFDFQSRGVLELKGYGPLEAFILAGTALSRNRTGLSEVAAA
jgi:class 3 adenylate cyclase